MTSLAHNLLIKKHLAKIIPSLSKCSFNDITLATHVFELPWKGVLNYMWNFVGNASYFYIIVVFQVPVCSLMIQAISFGVIVNSVGQKT